MALNQATILLVPLEIRWRIYDYVQPREETWYIQLSERVRINTTGTHDPDIVALGNTCSQIYHETNEYYRSTKAIDIELNSHHKFTQHLAERDAIHGAQIDSSSFSCLTSVRSLELDPFIRVTKDQVFETQLIEDIAAEMVKSEELLEARVRVDLQGFHGDVTRSMDRDPLRKLVTKLNSEVGKLRMEASRDGKRSGKKQKDCEAELCSKVIKLVKGWDYGSY